MDGVTRHTKHTLNTRKTHALTHTHTRSTYIHTISHARTQQQHLLSSLRFVCRYDSPCPICAATCICRERKRASEREIERGGERERQTERETERQTDRQGGGKRQPNRKCVFTRVICVVQEREVCKCAFAFCVREVYASTRV